MKYTRKLQQGGLLAYTPTLMSSPGQAAATGAAESKKSSIIDDDIIKELTTKGGLTNDTNALLAQLTQLEKSSVNPYLNSQSRATSLALIGKVNDLRQSKSMWNEAYRKASTSGGLGEVAVGDNGEVYTKDEEGTIQATTLEAYSRKSDKLQILSVADLLNERERNPKLVGQNNIFNVANNSIGIKNISDYAQKIVASLGKESQSNEKIYDKGVAQEMRNQMAESIGNDRAPNNEEAKGFGILDSVINSPSRYNEIMVESSSERNHAMKAVNYIWSTLGTNAQRKLSAQAALNGQKVPNLLLDMVIMGTDHSEKTTVKPISESKAKTGTDNAESLGGAKSMNNPQIMIHGTLGARKEFKFNDPQASVQFAGLTVGVAPLLTPDGKAIAPTTFDNVLKSGWEQVVDTNNIFFGNKKIHNTQLREISVDGMSEMGNVYLPVNEATGAPDYASLTLFRGLMDKYDQIKDDPNITKQDITMMFENSGFSVSIKPDKTIDVRAMGSNVKQFFVTWAYTNDASELVKDNMDPNNGGLRRLEGNEHDAIVPYTDSAYTIKDGKKTKNLRPNKRLKSERTYKGMVLIPLRVGATVNIDAALDKGPKLPSYSEQQVRVHAQNSMGNYVQPNMDVLNDDY